jgi:hypothetical protein
MNYAPSFETFQRSRAFRSGTLSLLASFAGEAGGNINVLR